MSWIMILKAVGIIVAGTILFRIGGRKSISQMTITQVVIMIGIGSLLVQPLSGQGYWVTIGVATVLILSMVIMEYIEYKADGLETLISGKSVVVIEHGKLHEANLDKLRLTVDKLEMRLRQTGIADISDVEWATLEVSGNLGYTLKSHKQPATKEDINQLMALISQIVPVPATPQSETSSAASLFSEIKNGHQSKVPEKWQ
ncbi:DUF421 domain-containing protein [Paenibacillus sp. p3-SID867]|uniref:DUF421 domain-containing protein n=1 Tax=Paenibacillus sp. p3-SID867 TaxID=2916363 RepID=UPI0021A90CC5|nr:DUF421 domain-containing protein [Paenibacillus sp. p3-SID867]MCT1399816.1 DUF421 domain-containing protein [Paenibacillus sp. p3-SID867]